MKTSSIYGPPAQPRTIHEEFYQVAQKYPERLAVRSATQAATYAQVASASRRITAGLVARGVGVGDIVPVVSRRSVELPAVLLGILASGAAYGMLDVRWPLRRLQHLVSEMQGPLVVADSFGVVSMAGSDARVLMPEEMRHMRAEEGAAVHVSPESCAAVFWTSGSTGSPKAVLSPHRATTRLFSAAPYLDYGRAPVMIGAAAVAWDAFTLELWGMLLLGGTLIVHEADLLLPSDLRQYIGDFGATHLFLTPSLADVIIGGDLDCLDGLRCLLIGGDKPTQATCQKFLAAHPSAELLNGYGPVESCVFATSHPVRPADAHGPQAIPAGTPVPGSGVHIVSDGMVLAVGEVGEVALSGAGLALRYLNEPVLTELAFPTITIEGRPCRVYMTGDRGHIDAQGVLHLAGRHDEQIKMAGHRIEPAEIEAAAMSLGSSRAVVLSVRDAAGSAKLILFAERSELGLTEAKLQDRLKATLPLYMLPSRVHVLPEFPTLDNTKIDRVALAEQFSYGI